jgi:hypothetical protein
MIQLRQLSWLSNGMNSSLLAQKVRLFTRKRAPLRQPGAPDQLRSGDTTVGTQ